MTAFTTYQIDCLAADYLAALESDDFETMNAIWQQAAELPELEEALHQVHAGVAEEQCCEDEEPAGPTVAEVAKKLPAGALTEKLLACTDEVPEGLTLGKLVTWAEAKFGPAPQEFWAAFRKQAIELESAKSHAAAELDMALAARKAESRKGKK